MQDDGHHAEIQAHYKRGKERGRLAAGVGRLEFIRTTEIILRRLPVAPAVVADIGGGPGRYALWLARLGYQVEHRDLMPLHVQQLDADAAGLDGVRTALGDARDLDLPDASVDAVLLLGPLYHLRGRSDRVRALAEARRVVRPRGELRAAGLTVADLVSVQGPAFLLGDLAERLDDPVGREVVLDTARAVERVPEMLGIGPHLLATGVR